MKKNLFVSEAPTCANLDSTGGVEEEEGDEQSGPVAMMHERSNNSIALARQATTSKLAM